MRKISIIAALVVAMTAVSCVKEMQTETPAPENNGAVTFEASFGAATKAVLEPGATESKVAWEAGDQVGVFADEGNFLYKAQNAGYSTTLSTDVADVPAEGPYYALYPYDADAVLAEGVVTTTLPAVQTAVLGSFTTHLSVAQAVENKFAFKNVCGLVGVKIDAENVTKIVLEGNNGEIVAGAINVTVADAPTWTAVAEQGATSVTLAPAEGTLAKGVYYFAVLPQTFANGFKVTAYKGEDASVVRNVASEFTLNRSDIIGSRAFGIDGSGTEADPYVLKTAQDMVDMRSLATVGGETWFRMANDIDLAGINWVPVNYDQNFERKIHFDGGNFTISNFTSDKSKHGANYPSLFGVLYGSCKNLKIKNVTITATNGCGVIGGYVGTTGLPGLVENVTVTNASITNSGDRAGGICGTAKEATFKNVSFQGTVICTYTAKEARSGGFAGLTETTAVFENCSADVVVVGDSQDLGGFVGKATGEVSFKGCKVKADITSNVATKNRCGGFLGWNSTSTATFTDCHVLEGTTITNTTGRGSASNGNFGGFIGFGDTKGTILQITDCSAHVDMTVDANSTYNGGFIGGTGYESTATIKGCSAAGTVNGNNYVGGFIGAAQSDILIEQCSASVDVTSTGQRVGSFVGVATKPIIIRDCYSTGSTVAAGQQVGAILGYTSVKVIIERCYATGDITSNTAGTGGIVGTLSGASSEVTDCIAWNKNITCNRSGNNKWAPGAVVGAANVAVTLTDCYRRADMNFVDAAGAMVLEDHENVSNATPPFPSYFEDATQAAYHGKAAAADATVSSVAKELGWSEDIWDLSGDVPVLK